MCVPISSPLSFPESVDTPMAPLDLPEVGSLTFERPDTAAFPCLELAREAAAEAGTAPCTLNAANEIAVHAFLGRRISFMDIPRVIEGTLESAGTRPVHGFEDLYEAD